jgi:hypothetical protein
VIPGGTEKKIYFEETTFETISHCFSSFSTNASGSYRASRLERSFTAPAVLKTVFVSGLLKAICKQTVRCGTHSLNVNSVIVLDTSFILSYVVKKVKLSLYQSNHQTMNKYRVLN